VTPRTEVLLIGGRSGVGKSTVGHEIHAQLAGADMRHCLIEGDKLDMADPPPQEDGLAERNLAAMLANYRALGYHRLFYTNTVSVLGTVITDLTTAIGGNAHVTAILLRCTSQTARYRLSQREIGSSLAWHLQRSTQMARKLDNQAPRWVHRIDTDQRTVSDIAGQVIDLAGWRTH
jgi:hypothetical protein